MVIGTRGRAEVLKETSGLFFIIAESIMRFLLSLLVVLCFQFAKAQENRDPEPKGGLAKLGSVYFKISFTPEQRAILEETEVEFIYLIDTTGTASLEKINGVEDRGILDSLERCTSRLPAFYPQIIEGVKQPAIYFFQLRFPKYAPTQYYNAAYGMRNYRKLSMDDFESIEKSPTHFDMVIGGMVNQFTGNASDYLKTGGGMKLDMAVGKEGKYVWGMAMNFYGNAVKKYYSVNTNRVMNDAPPTLLIGVVAGKEGMRKGKTKNSFQLELCYAVQNVSSRTSPTDEDYIQWRGFSPGLVYNYQLYVGGDRLTHYYGEPTLFNNIINVHAAIRPIFFDWKEASGIMLEVGVSYRMSLSSIKAYKLKQGR